MNENTVFFRDQKRIDEICWKLHGFKLLPDNEIHRLAHDWGDIEDAAAKYLKTLERLRLLMNNFEKNPKECWEALLHITGWYDEMCRHMRSANNTISALYKAIERRYPNINPEKDE